MQTLDDLLVKVNEMDGVVESTVEFIDWLKVALEEANGDKDKIAEVIAKVDAQKLKLGAAIANTPIPPVEEEPVA
jgi:hypothetical protein